MLAKISLHSPGWTGICDLCSHLSSVGLMGAHHRAVFILFGARLVRSLQAAPQDQAE